MKIALINGSPKARRRSASGILLKDLKTYLPQRTELVAYSWTSPEISEEILGQMMDCDALVIAFPLYVDAIPSHLLSCLCQIERSQTLCERQVRVYSIANCGFFEGRQNAIALEILENWCERAGFLWGGGVGIGCGGAISMIDVPPGKGPKKSLGKALEHLCHRIGEKQEGENAYVQLNFPKFLYKLSGEAGWRKAAKKNGLQRADLSRRL